MGFIHAHLLGTWVAASGTYPLNDLPIKVLQSGTSVAEVLTEADAVGGTLTFSTEITAVRILNTDASNDGVFTVNGLDLHVPSDTGLETHVAGTPATTVTITGATTYVMHRLV